jgi:WD40 repeat protein
MKYYFHFFITAYFLLNIVTCNAMNEQQVPQSKIITEITGIQNPRQGTFLNNNDIVLHGRNGCKIINRKTHDEIVISDIKINDIEINYLAVHPQGKKLALSLTGGNKITLYNTETRSEESIIQCGMMITRSTFNPLDETIFVWGSPSNMLLRYNYQTKCCNSFLMQDNDLCRTIACHPTQRRFITGMFDCARIYKYEQDGNFIVEEEIPAEMTSLWEYSPDGSFIVGIDEHNIYMVRSVLSVDAKYVVECLFHQDKAKYWNMKIHPNGSVLATLLESNDIICYWDVKEKVLIDVTQSISSYYRDHRYANPHLSFSPNGKMLAVTSKRKCIVIPVPFEAMYHSITLKRHFLYIGY